MKILKAMVPVGAEVRKVDVIEYEGQFWLVPLWLDTRESGMTTPLRIISLAAIPHQTLTHDPHAQFAVNSPIHKALFELGPIPPELSRGYVIHERPPIQIRGGTGLN